MHRFLTCFGSIVILLAGLIGSAAAQPTVYSCEPPAGLSAVANPDHTITLTWPTAPTPTAEVTNTLRYDSDALFGFGPSDSLYSIASVRFSPTEACTLLAVQVFLYASPAPYTYSFNLDLFATASGGRPGGDLDSRYPTIPVTVPTTEASDWFTVDLRSLGIAIPTRRDFHAAFEKTDSLLFVGSDGDTVSYGRSWLYDPAGEIPGWELVHENWKIRALVRYSSTFLRESREEWLDPSAEPVAVTAPIATAHARPLPPELRRVHTAAPEIAMHRYRIQRAINDGPFAPYDSTRGDTTYVDTLINLMTTYHYRVAAQWDSCTSDYGTTASAICYTDPVSGLDTLRDCPDTTATGWRWSSGNSYGVLFDSPGPCELVELQYFLVRNGRFRAGLGTWRDAAHIDSIADRDFGRLETRAWASVTAEELTGELTSEPIYLNSRFLVWFTYVDTNAALGFDSLRTYSSGWVRRGAGSWLPESDGFMIRAVVRFNTGEQRYLLASGWNMVSLPMQPTDRSAAAEEMFPSAVSPAWWFNGSNYIAEDTLQPGRCYFVLIPGDTTYTVNGHPVYNVDTRLHRGWNMIGAVYPHVGSGGFSVADLVTTPPGAILRNSSYWFNAATGSYLEAPVLYPGRGAFILTGFEADLHLER